MGEEQGALKLLQQMPGINLTILSEKIQCCGPAGSYMLEHPQMAQALLDELMTAVLDIQPRYFLTSNIGCALHIAAGFRERGVAIEVLHPVVFVARNLEE